jgi:hypothetical protein
VDPGVDQEYAVRKETAGDPRSFNYPVWSLYFLPAARKQTRHIATCRIVEQGVARPMWNMDTGTSLLIRNATGIRTRNAPVITTPESSEVIVLARAPILKKIKRKGEKADDK